MTDTSRRTFLKHASVAAAVGGAAVAAPVAMSAADAEPEAATTSAAAHHGPFLARIDDAGTGAISVLVGEHEVLHHDPALARQLARLAARATQA